MKKNNYGITLIALAVTIIIMLILAGVTISALTGNSGISSNANQARIQNELAQYKEQMELYLAEKKVENYDFFIESLNAGKESLIYDGKPDYEKGNIKTIIPNIADEYIECLSEMWKQIEVHCSQTDVCVPILGSGLTLFEGASLSQQELLNIMIWSYKLSPHKIKAPYKLRIICKKSDGFSLNEIDA